VGSWRGLRRREEPRAGSRGADASQAAAAALSASEGPGGCACPLCGRVGGSGEAQAVGGRGCSLWGGPSARPRSG